MTGDMRLQARRRAGFGVDFCTGCPVIGSHFRCEFLVDDFP
jgi:hypothetical protein